MKELNSKQTKKKTRFNNNCTSPENIGRYHLFHNK